MAAEDTPAPQSIAERIAALRMNEVGRTPTSPPSSYDKAVFAKKAPPPPPLPKRPVGEVQRTQSTNNPPLLSNGHTNGHKIGNQPNGTHAIEIVPPPGRGEYGSFNKTKPGLPQRPSLPPRQSTQSVCSVAPSPPLPPRRGSEQQSLTRRDSNESVSSMRSARSSVSGVSTRTSFSDGQANPHQRVKAPAYDPSSLPSLPEKRPKEEVQPPQSKYTARNGAQQTPRVLLRPTISAPNVLPEVEVRPPLPSREPSARDNMQASSRPQPATVPKRSTLDWAMNRKNEVAPALPTSRPGHTNGTQNDGAQGNGTHSNDTPMSHTNSAGIFRPGTVQEATTTSFDALIFNSGKPAMVKFYGPRCVYCERSAPDYSALAASFDPSLVTIAAVNMEDHASPGWKYRKDKSGGMKYPTLRFFDGRGRDMPIEYSAGPEWDKLETSAMQAFITQQTGIRPNAAGTNDAPSMASVSPPPIPLSSRPDLAAIRASKPTTMSSTTTTPSSCLKCRDFSAPDTHASRFPRESIPSHDVSWLGPQLTSPFPSATDKARAIFTWLHHNIAYDTVSFFSKKHQPADPRTTMASGLAVCEGYAGLSVALAIASGLEAIVVSGHGKGVGYTAPSGPNAPLPAFDANHAWAVVKMDQGEWKLVDPCWGAGHLDASDGRSYKKEFNARWFTMSNEDFGKRHFPSDAARWYTQAPLLTWAQYLNADALPGGPVRVYGATGREHGIDEFSLRPMGKDVSAAAAADGAATLRFQFNKVCRHWKGEVHGKGADYLFVLKLSGTGGGGGRAAGGGKDEYRVFNHDGFFWWVDVQGRELQGLEGVELPVYAVTRFEGRDARGLTKGVHDQKMGRVAVGWEGVAGWRVV
ncbi:hypothetical protein LTS18_003202 [Coniosporium uncinatum]|uniref:Uncharacterized protein n=1 Tax=Coniosporium uncinatum TaxID=93489 RepID=A0ACC3D747_9PEZI|nr:hypothetical protein LTS18_003202 [Coniosporium uncinatum]